MKKKFSKILGVTLSLLLVMALAMALVPAVPVAADPSDVDWDKLSIPKKGSSGKYVMQPTIEYLGPMAGVSASPETLYVGAWDNLNGDGTVDTGEMVVFKSTDGGRTWSKTKYHTDPDVGMSTNWITDIVVVDADTVYVTDGLDIFKTTDGGADWAPLNQLLAWGTAKGWTLTPSATIVAMDVGIWNNTPYVLVGTSNYGGGTSGNAYVLDEGDLLNPWSELMVDTLRPSAWGSGVDVYDIRADPTNFGTTRGIIAVVQDRDGSDRTVVTHSQLGGPWNTAIGDGVLDVNNSGGPTMVEDPYRAQLWFPDNFNWSLSTGLMQYFVGIAAFNPAEGDVYRIIGGPTGPFGSYVFDLNVRGAGTATDVTGLDGVGNVGSATLMASGDPGTGFANVYRSTTYGTSWLANTKRPTGTTYFLSQAQTSLYMVSATVAYVATVGIDCGIHLTEDGGISWNGIGLLATDITLIEDLSLGSDGTIFLNTDSGPTDSTWRYASNWERVYSDTLSTLVGFDQDWVELTPDGSAVFITDRDGAATGYRIYRSLDNGQTWAVQLTPVGGNDGSPNPITSWVIIDQNTIVVGSVGVILKTMDNGLIWAETSPGSAGTFMSLALEPGYDGTTVDDILAGDNIGQVYLYSSSWSRKGSAAQTGLSGPTYVAFDAADTSIIYATAQSSGGVARRIGTTWATIDGQGQAGEWPVGSGTGIISALGPDGESVLYVTAGSTSTAPTPPGGLFRTLNPTDAVLAVAPAVPPYWENAGEGLANGVTFRDTLFASPLLWLTEGSPKLWSFDPSGTGMGVYYYVDTLAVRVPATGPADGLAVTQPMTGPWQLTLSWDALPGATNYQVQIDLGPNFLSGLMVGETLTYIAGATSARFNLVSGTSNNNTYYWRVRVAGNVGLNIGAPVRSYWSTVREFTTSPIPPAVIMLVVAPAAGSQNNALLPPFQWQVVFGADNYEWQLSTDPGFATLLDTANPTSAFHALTTALAYDTQYYSRVRAMVGTTPLSDWVAWTFRTMEEPAELDIILEQQDIDITVTSPDVIIPAAETPPYVWAIVAIGAILTIAVIILIIRTRRVV